MSHCTVPCLYMFDMNACLISPMCIFLACCMFCVRADSQSMTPLPATQYHCVHYGLIWSLKIVLQAPNFDPAITVCYCCSLASSCCWLILSLLFHLSASPPTAALHLHPSCESMKLDTAPPTKRQGNWNRPVLSSPQPQENGFVYSPLGDTVQTVGRRRTHSPEAVVMTVPAGSTWPGASQVRLCQAALDRGGCLPCGPSGHQHVLGY